MELKDINLEDYEISPQADEEIIVLRKKKHKYPKWLDLERLSGYYITYNSKIHEANNFQISRDNRDVFLTLKHAKSALAMAQISQLMPYYGGEITDEEWENSSPKYIIDRYGNMISITFHTNAYYFLAFHTKEQRDMFLENNEQLVKDYLMIE